MSTTSRANFLPEQRFIALLPALQDHLTKVGQAITPENFLSICDEMILKVLRETFDRVAADEGSIWLLDQNKKMLVAVYNNGPNSEKIVGFRHPMTEGIISLVVA